MKRLSFLDGLRGLAALYVLIFHLVLTPAVKPPVPTWLHSFLMFGDAGVTLFFVVSAFSLSLTVPRHAAAGHALLNYTVSRLFRIVPLFYLMMLATYVMHVLEFNVWHSTTDILLSASFLFNFIPGKLEGFVWASWTIGVEMLFYLAFPMLYAFQTTWARRIVVFCVAVALGIVFKGFTALFVPDALRASYENFSVFRQAPVFLIGMAAHALYAEPAWAERLRSMSVMLIAVGLLGLIGLASGRISTGLLDMPHLRGIGFALILLGCAGTKFVPVDNPVTRFLGKISYSIYLLHAPVIWLMAPVYAWVIRLPLPGTLQLGLCLAATLAVVVPLAWLSFRWLEAPSIALGKRVFARMTRNRARTLLPAEA